MKCATDVHYVIDFAYVGIVEFESWDDSRPRSVHRIEIESNESYQPGEFYRRELPPILGALKKVKIEYADIVIDGYVHLASPLKWGLGMHLSHAMNDQTNILGIAKSRLPIASDYIRVYRGKSKRPLYVSSNNYREFEMQDIVSSMHGSYRLPTLIKAVDQVSRGIFLT